MDLLFTTQLQLRLAHDIAVLYRVPIDLDDPDDLWKLVRVAFVVKAERTEPGGRQRRAFQRCSRATREEDLQRLHPGCRKEPPCGGEVPFAAQTFIKFAIPVISVPISTGVNYWSTRVAGQHARGVFRQEARIAEAARRIVGGTHLHDEVLWVLWLIATVDGPARDSQRLLLHHVTAILDDLEKSVSTSG